MNFEILKSTPGGVFDKRARILTQFALSIGAFAVGTAEFVSMGLLPEMAQSTGVDIPTAGHYISSYALGVVIGAPVLAVFVAKLPRKAVLIGLMVFYAISNILSGYAHSYNALMLMRFLSGLPHGIFFGVASVAVSSMVPMQDRPKAIGNVVLGLTIATVIGAPTATMIGQLTSWSVAFALVGAVGALCALLTWVFMPFMPTAIGASPLTELSALKEKQVWLLLGVVAIGSGGMFAVFTYIKSILMDVSGFSLEMVPFIMPLVGCGMVVGNLVGPYLAQRLGIMKTILYSMIASAGFYFLFYFLTFGRLSVAIGCFLVGLSFASMPSVQTRIMDVASKAPTLGGALIQSAFNVANSLGAWAGGIVLVLGFSYSATAILGGMLTLGGALIFALSWYIENREAKEKSS